MTVIIDKRNTGKNKAAGNRKRFLDRHREALKDKVDQVADVKSLKGIVKDGEVRVRIPTVSEPKFRKDYNSGTHESVHPGNERYKKGDSIPIPRGGEGPGGKRPGGGGDPFDDEFTFTLTKEEFLDIYFSNMELPNFIKENLIKGKDMVRRKAGYIKEGIPPRLNIKKTFEQAIARRIATKAGGKKPAYLDDVDLRYDHYIFEPKPVRHAVMFCLMDVSGSMGETEKSLAKRFYILLYLFLHKAYETVDIRFIRHTEVAEEVTEKVFFYDRQSGGTIASSGVNLVNKIIEDEYDLSATNCYVAQASDGDNFACDEEKVVQAINQILPKIQYYVYVQISQTEKGAWGNSLWSLYDPIASSKNFNRALVRTEREVFPALQGLFKKV